MKSPCYKCLLLASCRHKEFKILLHDCKVVFDYLWPGAFSKFNTEKEITTIEKDMHPTTWFVVVDEKSFNASIIDYPTNRVISGALYPGEYNEDALYKE